MSSSKVSIVSPDKKLSMVFAPEVGGSILRFDLHKNGKSFPILRPYDEATPLHEFNTGNFPMVPMCGRTDHGQLVVDGKTYNVGPASEGEPHPNHGNGRSQSWKVIEQADNHIRMELTSRQDENMPYDYAAFQDFTLDGNTLRIEIGVKNEGKQPMPFGVGQHLYPARTPKTTFQFSANNVWNTEGMIPVEQVPVPERFDFSVAKTIDLDPALDKFGSNGTAFMDHCFDGYGGETIIRQPENDIVTTYRAGDITVNKANETQTYKPDHFIAFIPASPTDFICCFAPSNMPNAFNMYAQGKKGTGTVILQPGESMSNKMTLEIS